MLSLSNTVHDFDFARNPATGAPVTLSPQAVALMGGSATGKSVLIQQFARQYASNGGGFIVFDPNAVAAAARERYLRAMGWAGRERDFFVIDFNGREVSASYNPTPSGDGDELVRQLAGAVMRQVMAKTEVSIKEVVEHQRCALVCLPAVHPPAFNKALSRAIFEDLAVALKERTPQGESSEHFFVGLDDPFTLWPEKYAAEGLGKLSEATSTAGIGLVFASQSSYCLVESWPTKVVLGRVRDRDISDAWTLLGPSADEDIAVSDIPAVLRSLKPREALVSDALGLTRVAIPVWTSSA